MNKFILISISLLIFIIGAGCASAASLDVNEIPLSSDLGDDGNSSTLYVANDTPQYLGNVSSQYLGNVTPQYLYPQYLGNMTPQYLNITPKYINNLSPQYRHMEFVDFSRKSDRFDRSGNSRISVYKYMSGKPSGGSSISGTFHPGTILPLPIDINGSMGPQEVHPVQTEDDIPFKVLPSAEVSDDVSSIEVPRAEVSDDVSSIEAPSAEIDEEVSPIELPAIVIDANESI